MANMCSFRRWACCLFSRCLSSFSPLRPSAGALACGKSTLLAETDRAGLVVFVPGVAFDPRGNRLGRGKGWYDRLLERLGDAMFVALAYEFQIIEEVPTESWDQKVHYVVTENRVIDCAESSAQSNQIF